MEKTTTDDAPSSIGPFSQAVRDGETVYVSGQGPVDPESGKIVGEDIGEQTARTLENVGAILREAGGSLNDAVKVTVFVTDMDDYDAVNEVYGEFFSDPYPARSAIEVSALPIDIGVEIEVVASC